jgi:hypothetical protein
MQGRVAVSCGIIAIVLLAVIDTHSGGVITKHSTVALFGSQQRGIRDITVGRSYGDRSVTVRICFGPIACAYNFENHDFYAELKTQYLVLSSGSYFFFSHPFL